MDIAILVLIKPIEVILKKKMNCIQVFRDRLKDFILSSTHKLLYACNCSSTKIVKDAQTLKDFESLRSTGTYRFIVDF